MSTLAAALAIVRKDLRIYFRDRVGLALGFLLPLVLVTVFAFVNRLMAGGGGSAFSKASLWVADEDLSEASRRFVAALRAAKTLTVHPSPDEKQVDAAGLREKLKDGEAHHALIVEKGFGASLDQGELPTLRLLRDPDRDIEEQLISIGLMQATFSALGPDAAAPLTARALELAGLPKEWRERITAVAKTFTTSVAGLFKEKEEQGAKAPDDGPSFQEMFTQIVPLQREDFRPPERPKQLTYMMAHTISGTSVMMLMFGLVACASLLLREREGGTLPRLLLAPSDHGAILWGKFLFTAAIGATQLVILFAFGALVFHVDVMRDPASFLIVTASLLAAVTAFGMLIATWARTTKQAEGISTLAILVMSAVGGAWFPLQMLDLATPVRVVMGCTLTHWAVSAYQGLFWYGKSWSDGGMLASIGVMIGFALVASLLSRRLFERRYVGD